MEIEIIIKDGKLKHTTTCPIADWESAEQKEIFFNTTLKQVIKQWKDGSKSK